MKVLLLDDENTKATKVKTILREKCGLKDEDIDIVTSLNDAAAKMNLVIYDLLIADMCVPEKFGQEPLENGGVELVKLIANDKRLKAPRNIIVLTAYRELKEKYKIEIEKQSFDTIVYSSSSKEWEQKIEEKLSYLKRIESSPKGQRNYDYDVAIVTAVPREYKAIQNLSKWRKVSIQDDSTVYNEMIWKTDSQSCKIISTQLPQMGMVAAATISMKLIQNFAPKYIIMPGIAAGIKDAYEYGDIIIPREVKEYCSGKYETPKSEEEVKEAEISPLKFFTPTALSLPTDEDVINHLLDKHDEALQEIHKEWPGHEAYKVPSIRTGYMASGDSVIQNKAVVKMMIEKHLRQADGLDMEAYGMYYAARNALQPKPIPICMKAISDFADREKSDIHQAYAAYVSAKFMQYFVLNVLMPKLK